MNVVAPGWVLTDMSRDVLETDEGRAVTVTTQAPRGTEAHQILHHDVRSLLEGLTQRQRQLLWLAYVEGFSHREIAGQLGLGTDSVRQLLLRARRRLATLARQGELAREVSS